MKRYLMLVLPAALGVTVLYGVGSAWAGAGGGDEPSCLIAKPSSKAVTLVGNMAVDVTSHIHNGNDEADFIVRLSAKHGEVFFFGRHWSTPLAGLDTGHVVCRLFNPNDTVDSMTQAAVNAFLDQVRSAFNLPSSVNFYISAGSISNDGGAASDEILIRGTEGSPHYGGSADITIFAQ